MAKIKTINKKTFIGKTLTITSLVALSLVLLPIKAQAIGALPGDPKTGKLSPVAISPTGISTTMKFNTLGKNQKNWYDNRNSNKVFLQGYKGFTWYAPVPQPANVKDTQIRSYDYVYENVYNSVGNSVDFKGYSKPKPNYLGGNKSWGVGLTNTSGNYKGSNGEWRYMGYSSLGNVVSNPFFPPDVTSNYTPGSYPYDISPWGHSKPCPDGKTRWDLNIVGNSYYYNKKIDAINMLRKQESTMKLHDATYWAKRLSLRTDPSISSAIFTGSRGNGTYYRDLSVLSNVKNLRVTSQIVKEKDTGKTVGTYTRSSSDINNYTPTIVGGTLKLSHTYTVTAVVKNMSNAKTVTNPSLLDVGYGNASVWNSNDLDFSDNQYKLIKTEPSIYSPNQSKTFTWEFTVDSNFGTNARVTALINSVHHKNADNLDGNDDSANIPFSIGGVAGKGDFKVQSIKLVGTDGREYDQATPGQNYKIRYYTKYTGVDIKIAIYVTKYSYYYDWYNYTDAKGILRTYSYRVNYSYKAFDHWEYPKCSIPLKLNISRNLPNIYRFGDVYKESIPKSEKVLQNSTYVYTTSDYRTYEVPVIETTGIIEPDFSSFPPGTRLTSSDLTKEWHEMYDLSVSNVKVLPLTETPYTAGYQTFAVQYDIDSLAPSWLGVYEKDALTLITLKDKTVSTNVHLSKGANDKITEEMTVWIDPKVDKNITATVITNFDKKTWEEDVLVQGNNKDSSTADIEDPYDPYSGPPVQNDGNSWVQSYNIHNWTGVNKAYYSVGGTLHRFNDYLSLGDTPKNISQNESYKITSIQFRSKLTTDTKQGVSKDGWVELTTPGVVGSIKAGYGYELKTTVKYATNAFAQPSFGVSGTYNERGNWVRPYNVAPNLPNQLFVKTPDAKILSVDGYANTNPGLVYNLSGDGKSNATWTYTIKSKDTLGVKSVPKIFIDENTKDGTYNLKVFTPAINGVPTKTSGSVLCDSKTVKIKVEGSYTDDLKSHITQ